MDTIEKINEFIKDLNEINDKIVSFFEQKEEQTDLAIGFFLGNIYNAFSNLKMDIMLMEENGYRLKDINGEYLSVIYLINEVAKGLSEIAHSSENDVIIGDKTSTYVLSLIETLLSDFNDALEYYNKLNDLKNSANNGI